MVAPASAGRLIVAAMPTRAFDPIECVDATYQVAVAANASSFERELFTVLEPHLDVGLGAVGYQFHVGAHGVWVSRAEDMVGDPVVARSTRACFERAGPELVASTYRAGPLICLNRFLGTSIREFPLTRELARDLGAFDFVGISAVDTDGHGWMLCAPLPKGVEIDSLSARRWRMLAAHFVAGRRLHRAVQVGGRKPVEYARSGERSAVRQAARRLERGCDVRGVEGLSLWQVLASGRWSLIRTGRGRYVVYENPAFAPDPRVLTERQRIIAQYVALGHSNKLIAYQLGCAESTVSNTLTTIRRKLRVRSRAEIARLVGELSSTPATWVDDGAVRYAFGACADSAPIRAHVGALTDAERAVAAQVVQGKSNREIAAARGASERTIANQIASVFAKAGVHSRAELAALDRRPPKRSVPQPAGSA
jgi:DNA-binding CsgD family transcriptional regulator